MRGSYAAMRRVADTDVSRQHLTSAPARMGIGGERYIHNVIKGFSHVQLVVGDIDASVQWYGTVLGMECMSRGSYPGGDYAALRSPSGRFVFGLQTGPSSNPSSIGAGMIDHLSFAVEDRDDLERHRNAVVAAGIEASALIEEAASWNFRFRDPDGLLVELTAAKASTG